LEPTGDIEKYYQAMDLFVFPSIFEGLGMVMIEAQCNGLRCIISDRVSKECIVTKDQVKILSLEQSSREWALQAIEMMGYARKDASQQVAAQGYDISNTTREIQQFYLDIQIRR